MKIEKITKLKNGLYQLSLMNDHNEEMKYKLTEDVLIENNLYSNKVLSESELGLLESLANYSKLYTSTLNYIAFKMRTEKEVREYLIEKKCNEKIINEIVIKLKKMNYINDQIFSDSYVKYQFDSNKKGINIIKNELLKKGINLSIIDNSLNYIKPNMIVNNINHLIHYYNKVTKNKTIRKMKENILKNLITKGYEYEDIVKCLSDFHFEADDESLIEKELNKIYSKYQKKYQGYELKNKVIKALMTKGFEYEDITSNLDDLDFNE